MNKLKNENIGNIEYNYSVTTNGALGYASTGEALVDLNFQLASLRNVSESTIVNKFEVVYHDNKELALKWLFFARDILEGAGERRVFRVILNYLGKSYPNDIRHLVQYVPMYGRWDDVFSLFDTELEDVAIDLIKNQFHNDITDASLGKSISLLAKWMPSMGASSKQNRMMAEKLAKKLGVSFKNYRKNTKYLRGYLDIIERDMSMKAWDKIDYASVPSLANLKYKDAFIRNDFERRTSFLGSLAKGETKVNAGVLEPHEIVHKYNVYRNENAVYDETLEQLWKSLKRAEDLEDTLVVSDSSGSMLSTIGRTNVSMLTVSTALAVYFSESLKGDYKDKFVTFSESPKFIDLSNCKTLHSKLKKAFSHSEVANTNIEKTMKLVLDTAVKNKMKQEDLPKNILIISDMEFDSMSCDNQSDYVVRKSLFEEIGEMFKAEGYVMPRITFWNLNGVTNTIPMTTHELGVGLISGFSTNLLKMVMDTGLTPYSVLFNALMSERYAVIKLSV